MLLKTCVTEMSNPIVRTDLNHSGQIRSSQPNRPVRLAFYSHDTMGMGHIRRNLLIATAIVRDCPNVEILLIAGTREAAFFATEAGLDCVTLPALTKSADGRYSARHLGWSLEETTRLRSRIIQAAMEEFSPDVFVVDKLPRGIGMNWCQRLVNCDKRALSVYSDCATSWTNPRLSLASGSATRMIKPSKSSTMSFGFTATSRSTIVSKSIALRRPCLRVRSSLAI